jgi:hypothetical protein
MSVTLPTNVDLRPYGFAPGDHIRWCVSCRQEVRSLGPRAYKCRPCAVKQWRAVEQVLNAPGVELPSNPVPPERK